MYGEYNQRGYVGVNSGHQVFNPQRNDSGSLESFDRRGVVKTPVGPGYYTDRSEHVQQPVKRAEPQPEEGLAHSFNTKEEILIALQHRKPEIRGRIKCILTTDAILLSILLIMSILLIKLSWLWTIGAVILAVATIWVCICLWVMANETECYPTGNQILDNYSCARLFLFFFTMAVGVVYLCRAAIRSDMFTSSRKSKSGQPNPQPDNKDHEDAGTSLFWILAVLFSGTSLFICISSIRLLKTVRYWRFLAGLSVWDNKDEFEDMLQ